jgi:hypothetical protein
VAWCYPIGSGPDVERKPGEKICDQTFIFHPSSQLKLRGSDSFSGFPGDNARTGSVDIC